MVVDDGGGEGKSSVQRSVISDQALDVGFDAEDVGVAIAVSVSVRASAEGEIGKRAPVLEVVAAGESGG